RHKGQVIAAGLVLVALLAGIAGTTWGLIRAEGRRVEARKAQAAEAERVAERDEALAKAKDALDSEAQRVKERDNANDELNHRLGVSNMVLAGAAYDNLDVKLAAERLDKVPEEQRGWDWRYLKQQTFGGLFTLRASATKTVAFSPDGTRIVTGGWISEGQAEVKMWDARTGKELFALKGLPNIFPTIVQPGASVAFNPDGTQLVTASSDKT